MKRREVLKLLFGSLVSLVVETPLRSKGETLSFVDLCNLAISHEYGAIVQYINHSGLVRKKKVKETLLSNMKDEIVHARRITEILVKEGATPTIAIWPPQTAKNLKKLIQEDIEGESAAINLYEKILELPETSRYKDEFNNFLKREITHRERLKRVMNELFK